MSKDRDVEKIYTKEDFVAELRRLADAIESDEAFEIDIDDEQISIPEGVTFSIEHEREDGREELEFQLSWEIDEEEDEEDDEDSEDEEESEEDANAPAA